MKLEEIEKLCSEATPGTWEVLSTGNGHEVLGPDWTADLGNRLRLSDAKFIVMVRTELPKLLEVAKAANKYIKQVQKRRPEFADYKALVEALEELEKE